MRKGQFVSLILLAVLAVFCADVFAGRTWYYSYIGGYDNPNPGQGNSALGMRSGGVWPVCAYKTQNGEVAISTMTSAGWSIGGYFNNQAGLGITAASSTDGTTAFANRYGEVMMLSRNGWRKSNIFNIPNDGDPLNGITIALDKNSQAYAAHHNYNHNLAVSCHSPYGWITTQIEGKTPSGQDVYDIDSEAYAIATDSYGNVCLAYDDWGEIRFGYKGSLTGGDWLISEQDSGPSTDNPGKMRMAMTSNDVPWVFYDNDYNNEIDWAVFNRQTNQWQAGFLDITMAPFGTFSVAADGKGGVGVAYISEHPQEQYPCLAFAYNDGANGWEYEYLREAGEYEVGLAFDSEDNPVISYFDMQENALLLAYDPVVTPEPATALMLGLGVVLARRRKV